MKNVAVSEFRTHLMKFLKEIENGEMITITSRGKAVAKLVPPDNSREIARQRLLEIGRNAILRDVLSPVDEEWEGMK